MLSESTKLLIGQIFFLTYIHNYLVAYLEMYQFWRSIWLTLTVIF